MEQQVRGTRFGTPSIFESVFVGDLRHPPILQAYASERDTPQESHESNAEAKDVWMNSAIAWVIIATTWFLSLVWADIWSQLLLKNQDGQNSLYMVF